eukprot:CAMPEP_0113514890 /NCGR_PEP_ID=MMETSP0014_2-20120614/40650_1 /TAXON_ID=2857 /ORGANISM="Nitzschia sp." /LENGTH=191 /DNA_ID=CAMNT_0000411417 /DNA_START=19 /DNA_END=594 /DNA_ORIENTATION=+ /assembly_acc=CAM_ASM_000159
MTSPLEEINKAYEDAVSAERQRRESLEAQEIEMDVDALHTRLKEERQRMAKISGELAKLKITSLQRESSNEFHEEEEFNMFLKHQKEAATDQQHPPQKPEPESKVRHNLGTQNPHPEVQEILREEQKLNSVLQKKLMKLQDENLKLKQQLESSSSPSSTSPSIGIVGSGALPPITDYGDDEEEEEAEEHAN